MRQSDRLFLHDIEGTYRLLVAQLFADRADPDICHSVEGKKRARSRNAACHAISFFNSCRPCVECIVLGGFGFIWIAIARPLSPIRDQRAALTGRSIECRQFQPGGSRQSRVSARKKERGVPGQNRFPGSLRERRCGYRPASHRPLKKRCAQVEIAPFVGKCDRFLPDFRADRSEMGEVVLNVLGNPSMKRIRRHISPPIRCCFVIQSLATVDLRFISDLPVFRSSKNPRILHSGKKTRLALFRRAVAISGGIARLSGYFKDKRDGGLDFFAFDRGCGEPGLLWMPPMSSGRGSSGQKANSHRIFQDSFVFERRPVAEKAPGPGRGSMSIDEESRKDGR